MKTLAPLITVLISLSFSSVSAQEFDAASYIKNEGYSSGWANISPPQGGMFVYTPASPDSRIKTQPFSIGRPKRQTYQLFSAQEEEALWLMREKKIMAAAAVQEKKGRRRIVRRSLAWPKVVVRGPEICVPILDHSDSNDWQQHLTCWSPKDSHVE